MIMAELLSLFLSCVCVISATSYNEYIVPCDSTTDYCECPSHDSNGNIIDVCSFSLEIIRLQTFTSYTVDPVTKRVIPYNGGSVWYINGTTSEFQPFPHSNTVCSPNNTATCTHPFTVDGKTFRSLLTINGRFPGPTIIVSYNQTVKVSVTNSLQSHTLTIHWHGIHQRNTNWMDGVQRLSQCDIAPGNIFNYIFQANPTGTFWYHSHVGSDRVDGVYGAFIIREPIELFNSISYGGSFIDNPNKYSLLLQDFFMTKFLDYRILIRSGISLYNSNRSPDPTYTNNLRPTIATDGSYIGGIPFWSGLINGLGRYPGLDYTKSRLSIFTVLPQQRYRFRIIGSLTRFALRFSIDEHRLIVIATDGSLIKPISVDYIIIHAGERYDIILETKSINDSKYRNDFIIRAETLEISNDKDDRQPLIDHLAEGILHYNISNNTLPMSTDYYNIANKSLPIQTTCTVEQPCVALNCIFKAYPPSYNINCIHIHELELLTPLQPNMIPNITPDEYIILNFGFEGSGKTSSVNARKQRLPSSPLAVTNDNTDLTNICRELDNPSYCNDTRNSILASECICTHIKDISSNQKSIQVVLTGVTGVTVDKIALSSHPIHLHGHYLQIVDIQFGNYTANGHLSASNSDIDCQGETEVCTVPIWSKGRDYSLGKVGNVSNIAPLKDTVIVPAGGYVVGYLLADNPGYWLLHCHVSDHLSEGMSVIINEYADNINSAPNGMKGQCGDFNWNVEDYYKHIMNNNNNTEPINCNDNNILLITLIGLIIVLVVIEIVLIILYCKFVC